MPETQGMQEKSIAASSNILPWVRIAVILLGAILGQLFFIAVNIGGVHGDTTAMRYRLARMELELERLTRTSGDDR